MREVHVFEILGSNFCSLLCFKSLEIGAATPKGSLVPNSILKRGFAVSQSCLGYFFFPQMNHVKLTGDLQKIFNQL